MLHLDSTSAGVVAGIYSALLIAIAVRRPSGPREDAPKWGKVLVYVLESLHVAAVLGATVSIVYCVQIVCGGESNAVAEAVVTATLSLLQFAVTSWIFDYIAPAFLGRKSK